MIQKNLISISEVAKAKHKSPQAVYPFLKRNKIAVHILKVGGVKMKAIHRNDLEKIPAR